MPDKKRRILIAPLDWGLGHTTRCIPIIISLLRHDCEVFVAAEGPSKELLKNEFPELIFLELKGYRVQYSQKRRWMFLKLAFQVPKLIFQVFSEHSWLGRVGNKYNFDAVISDNRPGLYHKSIPSVYMTHQLCIKTGNSLTDKLVQKIHYHFINKFSQCWVPDASGELSLAGDLSHPLIFPTLPVKYIGPLSRFERKAIPAKYSLSIILSGPEPQRSVFENIVLKYLENYSGCVLLVRGLPGNSELIPGHSSFIEIENHLSSAELSKAIQESELIIARCGYSTVMDLIKLGKRAVLIPTPGQTEQEYLAKYLMEKNLFYCVDQAQFSLNEAIDKAGVFPFVEQALFQHEYENVLKDFINRL